jgi:hypothetical protein
MCGLEKGLKGKRQLAKKKSRPTPSTIFFFSCDVPHPKNDFHQK